MHGFPRAHAGMRIGLLGGSFDPAHAGHAHVARTGLSRLKLDAVWWLVSPQNPLKPKSSPLADRMVSARKVARGRRMVVSDLETRLGTAYTIDTLRALKQRYHGVHFVWLMGGDNLSGFERWRGWDDIARTVPVCVVSRPGGRAGVRMGKLAMRFSAGRMREEQALLLPVTAAPAWAYLSARWNPESSTRLRRAGLGLSSDGSAEAEAS
jgi:nicotinate-nucleotide adenylyltransferase